MTKRILALMLAAVLLLSCVSFASAEEAPVKLTALFIAHPLTKQVDEMKWIDEIEKDANVDVTWEVIYTDWNQLKTTRFAAGDIPDILINATGDSDYTTYKGLFMELTDLIDQYAPNVKAMFEEEPDTLALAKTLEGEIFATPKFQGKWPDCNGVMFVNKKWLDNLGLQVPTTLSEVKTVLQAFRDNDANGNGDPSDEVPMDFNGWFGGAYSLTNLIGSWGIQLVNWGSDAYFVEDGTVKNYAVDERYKSMMKYLADLYAENLINVNAITNDYSMFQSLSRGDADGNALVGMVMGWEETDKFGPNIHDQYVPCGPFTNDIDEAYAGIEPRWTYDFSGLNMSSNRACISAKCANPEAAMRFIDQFYRPEISVQGLFGGITDGCVAQTGDNSFEVLPPPEGTDAGTWKWTSTMADNAPMYIRRSTEIKMAQDMTYALAEREQYKEAIARINMDTEYYPQMFMRYTTEDQNTLAQLQTGITTIADGWWGLWLTGEADIDETWDDYVAEIEGAGLAQVLEIRQNAYNAYKGK